MTSSWPPLLQPDVVAPGRPITLEDRQPPDILVEIVTPSPRDERRLQAELRKLPEE